jgi:hypothetical protein
MKNDVYVIRPYKSGDVWVFDDPRFGLKAEPFVGDTNVVIDAMLAKKGITGDRFSLMFSRYRLPDYDACFILKEVMETSAWYWDEHLGIPFWLCPCLNNYFDQIPERIFIRVSNG